MTDTLELEIAIKRAGFTKKEIAGKLGITQMGLHRKMNNISEFKASEIALLYKLLNLNSFEEQQKFFFS